MLRRINNPFTRISFMAVLFAGLCAAQTGSTTLTFEGLQNHEPVLNYYAGGLGGLGSGPGPNYGITFDSDALASISEADGGTDNFSMNPSGITTVFFLQGTAVQMNVAAGFTTGFSFYYASGASTGVVTVYDGLNATGNILATLSLPATGSYCDPQFTYSCWATFGVPFQGVAKSVSFGGATDGIGFDNITIGSQIPGGPLSMNCTGPSGPVTAGTQYSATCTLLAESRPITGPSQVCRPG